ncbi:hypothetical protein Mgra_00002849 [Meloidogyne graminicola]|uniref:Decapping nuclease n=1 Tax=Meloidogyne graminicola TaxID=189291 RepID=A0A8S9ZVC2_9BILA|nr:hypothetical protein Mgra_00002849 [Meloidogyne graminicola]
MIKPSNKMSSLNLPNISANPLFLQYIDQKSNLLAEPVRVAEFSLDSNGRPILGRSKARYFYEPALGKGRKPPIKARLNDGYKKKLFKKGKMMQIHISDFVTCRGTLLRLMLSCYDSIHHSVGMKLACSKFKGVYFIREYYTDKRIEKEENMTERHSRMCYEAHKFKQIVTTKVEGKRPDFKEDVCVKPDFIGVFKVLKWWIQAYLAGIKKLVVGIHENSKLNQVELLDLGVLTNNLSLSGVNINCCFVFLYEFLEAVKKYLDMAPEGNILLSKRLPTSTEFTFQLLEEGSAAAIVNEVLSNEFKVILIYIFFIIIFVLFKGSWLELI